MNGVPARPRVSVVVPTRNRDHFLRQALASVLSNADPTLDLELIVVDSGAGLSTSDVAAQARAVYVRCSKAGAAAARNHGVQLATGDYIAFLDDDDAWTPGHLRAQVDWLEARHEFGAVLGQVRNIDYDFQHPGPAWPDALPADGFLFKSILRILPQVGATLVRRSSAEAIGPFDETLLSDEDWDWHLRLALDELVGFVPMVCVLFRARPNGTDDELQWMRFPFLGEVFWRNVRRGGKRSPSLATALLIYLRHVGGWHANFLRSAKAHARSGRRSSTDRSLRRAARVSPLHFAWSLIRDPEARRAAMTVLLPAGARSPQPDNEGQPE